MKVLLPFKKDLNPYLEEILAYTGHTFHYANYSEYDPSYDIVNIHWPEAIFDWIEPSAEQLEDLENNLHLWKKKSVIVYTKHDFQRNKGTTANFDKLFSLIEANTEVFIHLGHRSKELYIEKYPRARHYVIPHPLYINSYKVYSKQQARRMLGISENTTVIIAPGKIRTFEERKMVLNSFKKLKEKKKTLIATNMRAELQYDFRGRVRFKKIIDIQKSLVARFKNKYQPPDYFFTYFPLSQEELSLKVSAADVVLIPRIDILNSGNLFLGLTFNKVVVGPKAGNIEEHLEKLNMPGFDPEASSSVTKALEAGIKMVRENFLFSSEELAEYHPENIAKQLDIIFEKNYKE